ncbi:hypothetical protein VTK73DRAFT_8593 [Phialemonium thermophilum]|uniref:Uncharacterized protein n=1 Tax=Phialemonium thermophilum TaxID=223376 RepID=A0ABR3W7L7_9PEZI
MRKLLVGSGVLALVPLVGGLNFPFEAVQLNETDVGNFSAIAFGNSSDPASTPSPVPLPACREHPGSPHWPADAEWARLNSSLDGALLQPAPAAAVCYRDDPRYDESQCLWRLFNASRTRFYLDDPLNVLTQWPQGDTCPLSLFPRGRCTQGGSPVYVVNATSVRQIQIAVNFARNKNLRLVIKCVISPLFPTQWVSRLRPTLT